jgi:hypothetical protein
MASFRPFCVMIAVSVFAAGCGNPTDPPPQMTGPTTNLPVISGLTAAFSTGGCVRASDGLAGRALVIAFNFTDSIASTSGGHVRLGRLYSTGRSEAQDYAIPGAVTLTGTATAGQIRIDNVCPLYLDAVSSIETLTLIDAGGFGSNSLSTTVTRPAGAP